MKLVEEYASRLSQADLRQVVRGNAERVFKLDRR
jgi:hypothetical protein